MKRLMTISVILLALALTASGQGIQLKGVGGKGRVNTPKTKNIHGAVTDQSGKPVPGANVQVLNTKDNTSRTLKTDDAGLYSIDGLKPDVNWEVRADFKGVVSERKSISAFLDREDNLINFQLNLATASGGAANADNGPQLQTFDLVKLKASFEMPSSALAPIPAVLLLHGYGENRKVWEGFRKEFLDRGWAVMSLDLRGHGDSTTKNQRPIQASPDWRTNPREFPQDIDPALDWLKKQTRINSRKIVIVGYDIGADLALVSSGKFSEVRTIIAVKPNLNESLALAGSAQDFRPRSALVVTATQAEADAIKPYVKDPVRLLALPVDGGTAQVFQGKPLTEAVIQWLKETY